MSAGLRKDPGKQVLLPETGLMSAAGIRINRKSP